MNSDRKKRKKSRREDNEYDAPKKSLVDYSKVSSRPEAVSRRAGDSKGPSGPPVANKGAPAPAKMSAQMEAVVRLMAGKEERTIAQKLADSNRPTWDDYKKANEDKLNLEGMDQKKMEEYRRELDAEREKILSRGINHGATKKKKKKRKKDSESECSEEDRRRHKKKHKKKDRKKKKHKRRDDSSDSDDSDSDDKRRRKKKSKKKKSKKEGENGGDDDSDGSHYRLSKFFTAGSDSDD